MGCVGRPQPEKNFDGRILLEHISEQVEVQRRTAHHRFTDDYCINKAIRDGQWRSLYPEGTQCTVSEFQNIMGGNYGLDAAVIERLEFSYMTVTVGGKPKRITFNDH